MVRGPHAYAAREVLHDVPFLGQSPLHRQDGANIWIVLPVLTGAVGISILSWIHSRQVAQPIRCT